MAQLEHVSGWKTWEVTLVRRGGVSQRTFFAPDETDAQRRAEAMAIELHSTTGRRWKAEAVRLA